MIKVSDFIADYLVEEGILHVFMLTGCEAMHLNNSLGKHRKLEVIFNHHEQACALAAESYARLTNKLAVVNVASSTGCINALNGVFSAWTDSIPMLVLSGQESHPAHDIVGTVQSMTKYAVTITDASDIKCELQKALYFASNGRLGPVWLNIPLSIQSEIIDEHRLREYDFPVIEKQQSSRIDMSMIQIVLTKMQQAERPVFMVGTGVRLSGAYYDFLKVVEALQIPVVTAFNAHDVLPENHPCYVGRPGTVGDRPGNFAVQNSDLLIVLGCRLDKRQVGDNDAAFARAAYKIAIDVDAAELAKSTIAMDLSIYGDLADFFKQVLSVLNKQTVVEKPNWLAWCKTRQSKYPVVLRDYWQRNDAINPYCFIEVLNDHLDEGQIVVTGNATACISAFQALKIKRNQRLYSNSGTAAMGYDLPAAIGACFGSGRQRIICLAGDGSLQINIQELATIRYYQLPIKIFVLNNNGYHATRQAQTSAFGLPHVGSGQESGLFFPCLEKIAHAYEMQYVRAEAHDDLNNSIAFAMVSNKPAICEIILTPLHVFAPKVSTTRLADGRIISRPLEDLAPFLERAELSDNMLIDLISEV